VLLSSAVLALSLASKVGVWAFDSITTWKWLPPGRLVSWFFFIVDSFR